MSWRVAYSLDVLLAEVNRAAPGRSKLSDGSIGDAAHATRDSDHNPWVTHDGMGIVRARDFTHDPADGCDAGELAEAIRRLGIAGHPALGAGAYIIWSRRIASATYGWRWRSYNGSNPHTKHCHVSVAIDHSGFDSRRPWGVMDAEDWFDMATEAELRTAVRGEVYAQVRPMAVQLQSLWNAEVNRDAEEKALDRSTAVRLEALFSAQNKALADIKELVAQLKEQHA